jgi:hypothetical protein
MSLEAQEIPGDFTREAFDGFRKSGAGNYGKLLPGHP